MLVLKDVAHLVGDDLCVANNGVDVGVGMAVDPDVNAVGGTLCYTLLDKAEAVGVHAVVVFDRKAFAVEPCLVEVVQYS